MKRKYNVKIFHVIHCPLRNKPEGNGVVLLCVCLCMSCSKWNKAKNSNLGVKTKVKFFVAL